MIPQHDLSPAAFAAFTAGHVDSATLRELSAAQESRDNLLAAAALRPVADLPRIYSALATFSTAQERDRRAVARLCREAWFGVWAARCLDRARSSSAGPAPAEEDLAHLGGFAAVAALRTGMAADVWTTVRDGQVLLPGLGVASVPAAGSGWARLRVDRGALSVHCGPQIVRVPRQSGTDAPGWRALRRLAARAGGRHIEVVFDDLDSHRDCYGTAPAGRHSDERFARWQRLFAEAWELLVRHAPQAATQLTQSLRTIVPLVEVPGRPGTSATSVDAYGCLAMTAPRDPVMFAEILVHEHAHSLLNGVRILRRLHTVDAPERYYAPWRPDPRPLGGLLHGAFAFMAVSELSSALRADPALAPAAQESLALLREQLRPVLDALASAPALTADGRNLVAGLRRRWEALMTEPLPPAVVARAERLVEAHRIAWESRNAVTGAPGAQVSPPRQVGGTSTSHSAR